MKAFFSLIPFIFALAARAAEPVLFIPLQRSAPLWQLVALATRKEDSTSAKGYDAARCEALALLSQQPKVSLNRERTIKEALLASLSATQPQVRNAGAAALARRGYRAESAGLFSRLQTDPEPLIRFYRALDDPQKNPPIAHLRRGLSSSNPKARAAVAEVIGLCRIKEMAGELERWLDTEADADVRDQLAVALTLFGRRDAKDALLRLRIGGYQSMSLARAMIELGGEEQIRELIPMLWHDDAELRTFVAENLVKIPPRDREFAIDVLLVVLRDSSPKVRIASAQALARLHVPRAIPILRETLPEARAFSNEERTALVSAVADFGEELGVPLLNEMLSWRFREECGLEAALAGFGHPSSGAAAWNAYAEDLKKVIQGGFLVDEYRAALPVVVACADADLLVRIRETAAIVGKEKIKERLQGVAEKTAARLAQEAKSERQSRRPLPAAPLVADLPDSDKDGVPDVRDKYPRDDRRVEDIPVRYITFPEKRYAAVPLRAFTQDAPAPQFLSIDDESRVGYLTEENIDGAPAFRVVSTDGFHQREEWILPTPGALAGIEKLVPAAMHGTGTVIGTALWKPEAAAAAALGDDTRLVPGSGFVFKRGRITLDPAALPGAGTLRSTYKNIDAHGRIFGHREERIAKALDAPIRTVAFFDKHVFRDVPPFEVAAITRDGRLLCYRDTPAGRENFIWNGARFIPISTGGDAPQAFRLLPIKPVDMNAKLQVIGQLEQAGRSHAAFLWDKGAFRLLPALIPEEYSMFMQNLVPLFISDDGQITFTAVVLGDPSKPPKPQTFDLTLREGAENLLERKRIE